MRPGAGPRNDSARSLEIVELAELRGGLRVEVMNGHVGAKLRQANSNRMTQAAARSGHERDLSLQGKLFIHRSPFLHPAERLQIGDAPAQLFQLVIDDR